MQASLLVPQQPKKLQASTQRPHARHSRLHCRIRVLAHQSEYKELLGSLVRLPDEELAAWGAANRDRLTLPFLGWLANEELAAAGGEQQAALWALGSKLMALREGLSPVGLEVLQEELRAAALRACTAGDASSSSSSTSSGEEEDDDDGPHESLRLQGPAAAAAAVLAAAPPGYFGAAAAAMQQSSFAEATAGMGLSPEGLALFQQQAAALEAVVGASRARSLTEVIGRARVAADPEGRGRQGGEQRRQLDRLASADAAVRILEVLLGVQGREERAAMLSDAFTPPGSTADINGGSDEIVGEDDVDDAYFSPDEDQLSTTPLRLLQAIDLYAARLQRDGGDGSGALALPGGIQGLRLDEVELVLAELREDVEAYWQGGAGDGC